MHPEVVKEKHTNAQRDFEKRGSVCGGIVLKGFCY